MAVGRNIRTYFEGVWHDEDVSIMRAADHGSWLGSNVFDLLICIPAGVLIADDFEARRASSQPAIPLSI